MDMVEDESFILPKACSTKTFIKIIGFYVLIYIEYKGTIELTKTREKI